MYCHATGLGRSDLGSDTTLVNARIECAASDLAEKKIPPPPKRAKLEPARAGRLLSDVRFTVEPEKFHGICPVADQPSPDCSRARPARRTSSMSSKTVSSPSTICGGSGV